MRLRRSFVAVLCALFGIVAQAHSATNGVVTGTLTYATAPNGFGQMVTGFSTANMLAVPPLATALPAAYSARVAVICSAAQSHTRAAVVVGGFQNSGMFVGVSQNGTAFAYSPSTSGIGTSAAVCDGTRHWLTMVVDGTNYYFYADTARVATGAFAVGAPGNSAAGHSLQIGYSDGDSSFAWDQANEYLDEVQVYSSVLATGTTITVPSAPAAGSETNLVDLYHLDGNASDSAASASSNITLSVSPTSFPIGVVTPFTLSGVGTAWTGSTKPTVSGAGAYTSNVVVNGQQITGNLYPGTASGSFTFGDSVDSGTASATATASVTTVFVFDGDSLTYGTNDANPGTVNTTRIAPVLAAFGPNAIGYNDGVAGQTLVQINARVSTTCGQFQAGKTNYYVLDGGHNDINQNGTSAAGVVSLLQSQIAAIKACPVVPRIILQTMTPAGPLYYPASFNVTRNAVNAAIRANWRSWGIYGLADVAQDQRIGQDGQAQNGYYFAGDQIHLNQGPLGGYGIVSSYLLGAILNPNQAATGGAVRTGLVF